MKKVIIDEIGVFYFYENFMISEINQGVVVDLELALKVTNRYTKKYYEPHTPFVYISNRINSYSIKPTLHYETAKVLTNTKGYAVVIHDKMNERIAEMEVGFLNIPAKIFYRLDDAINWVDELIIPD